MPTISLTAKDLRQILENSRNYEAFARSRPVSAKLPAYDRRYSQRSRSRSRSKSRSRARSVSHSRAPNRPSCCNSKQCDVRRALPPGLPRPQSAKARPGSAKATYGERPRSAQTRPQSAKASLPVRPSSAHARPRHIEDYDGKEMDFTGLSNMMRKLTFQPTRKWKSKSPSRENNKKNSDIILEDKTYKQPVVDTNLLRKSRSSTYAKFKYPEKYHSSSVNRHLNIEENIPQCLRKFPRYINQPKRHNCNYNPQGAAVSWVASHNIKSGNLPPAKNFKSKRERRQVLQSSFQRSEQEPVMVMGLDTFRDDSDSEEKQRNGTFNYVFQSKQSDVVLDMDDLEDDEINGNARNTFLTTNGQNESPDYRPVSVKHQSQTQIIHSDDDEIEEIGDDESGLPRSNSEEEFERLLANIVSKPSNDTERSPSPKRPETPLSDFHDDEKKDNDFLNRPISPVYSDVESIPEEID